MTALFDGLVRAINVGITKKTLTTDMRRISLLEGKDREENKTILERKR